MMLMPRFAFYFDSHLNPTELSYCSHSQPLPPPPPPPLFVILPFFFIGMTYWSLFTTVHPSSVAFFLFLATISGVQVRYIVSTGWTSQMDQPLTIEPLWFTIILDYIFMLSACSIGCRPLCVPWDIIL